MKIVHVGMQNVWCQIKQTQQKNQAIQLAIFRYKKNV